MSHQVKCPNGHLIQIPADLMGHQVKCPACQATFQAESAPEGEPSEPAAGSPPMLQPLGASNGPIPGVKQKTQGRMQSLARAASASEAGSTLMLGRFMLMTGLFLVLLSKGCSTIGMRGVERSDARVDLVQMEFSYEWDSQIQEKMDRRDDIQEKIYDPDTDAEQETRYEEQIEDLDKDIEDLQEKRSEAQKKVSDKIDKLMYAAQKGSLQNAVNGYWREWAFVLATVVLALGLCITGWNAEGSERWICLAMLLVITLSVYVGGIAWIYSVIPAGAMSGGF